MLFMPLFPQQPQRRPLGDLLHLIRNAAAMHTSHLTLAATHERNAAISARFTPGMPTARHPLLEALRRRPEYALHIETVRKHANAPTPVQIGRMVTLLERIDNARKRGIPLAKAFGCR